MHNELLFQFFMKAQKKSYVNPRRKRERLLHGLFVMISIKEPIIIIVWIKEIYFTTSFYINGLLTYNPFIFVVHLYMFHISLCLDLTFFSRQYFPVMIQV